MNIGLVTITFIAINLDFFVILIFLLNKYRLYEVYVGYVVGLILLVSISFFAGQILKSIFPEWIVGILGILPIIMAFRDDEDENKINRKSGIVDTLITYLSICTGCNLSLFLPVLSGSQLNDYIFILVYIVGLSFIAVIAIKLLTLNKIVIRLMERYGEVLTKLCYIGIGIFVLFDSGFISHILSLC